jgi:hypothetical protein
MAGADRDDASLGDVYLEFVAVGSSMKVMAIHAATGTEVVVIGPVSAARSDLERLAVQKLKRRLAAQPPG